MKKFFSIFAAVAMVFAMASCEEEPVQGPNNNGGGNGGGNTGGNDYTMIASPLTLDFGWNQPSGQTVTVTTNAPDGFTIGETAGWYTAEKSGANKVIVTPQSNDGEARTHILKLHANGANDISIVINQMAKGEVAQSLKGQNYIVWQMDPTSFDYIKEKVLLNLMPDGNVSRLDIWPAGDSLIADETATGPNFYGNQGGYVGLKVGNIGWSGGGYAYGKGADDTASIEKLAAAWKQITDVNGEGWYLHCAVKGTKGAGSFFRLCDADPDAASSYILHWDNYDFTENDWAEIEVPMTTICAAGWLGATEGYQFTVHGSGRAGDKFHYDAVFIYQK